MSATRIQVEWMTAVPEGVDGAGYEYATWATHTFADIKAARTFGLAEVAHNPWGQVWIKTEHAPHIDSPKWQWETDHDADEILVVE